MSFSPYAQTSEGAKLLKLALAKQVRAHRSVPWRLKASN